MADRATYVCYAACDNLDHHPACAGRAADCALSQTSIRVDVAPNERASDDPAHNPASNS